MTVIPDPRGGHVWIYGVDGGGNPVKVLVDAEGHLQVEAVSVALPTGAATEASQSTMITALQLIDDLRNALASVATDDIRVAPGTNPLTVQAVGSDKLFAFEDTVAKKASNTNLSAGTNNLTIGTVPTGKVWVITNIVQYVVGTAPTKQGIFAYIDGDFYDLAGRAGAVDPNVMSWTGWLVLGPDDYAWVQVIGATAGDDLYARMVGFVMDAPS